MKHQETRTTGMAVSDAILVAKPGKNAQNTDGVFGSVVDGMNEQLDDVEDFEVECLTEEDPSILEEEKSPKLGLFLNTFTSFEDKEMVDVDGTIETGDASLKVEDAVEDKISAEVVEATKEIDNIPELNEEAATIQQDQAPLVDDETDDFHEAVDDQIAAELVEAV
jgi:orotate phosphoribosyltransferase-like protein